MGIRSSKLRCPKDYDKKKFFEICKIFHRLDEVGDSYNKYNQSLNYKNMLIISNVYYKYELIEKGKEIVNSFMEEDIDLQSMINETNNKIYIFEEKCFRKNGERDLIKNQKEEIIKYKLKNEKEMNKLRYKMNEKRSKISKYIDLIDSFNKEEKAKKLVEQIRGVNNYQKSIEFERFFKFFKHKDVSKIIETLNS